MQEFTITEFSDLLNLSYNGALKKVKKLVQINKANQIKFSEKISETGRRVKTVYVAGDLLNSLKYEHGVNVEPVKNIKIGENTPVQLESKPVQSDIVEKLVNDVLDSKKQLIELSRQVGQIPLLTDNLITKEKDSQHWQNKYFELKFELEQVKKENIELKEKLNKRWKFPKIFPDI